MSESLITSIQLILLTCMATFVSLLLKNIACTLSFTVLVISCIINPNFQTSGPRAEQVSGRGGLPSSLFRKITQQYILPSEYANSANFLFSKLLASWTIFLRKTTW